MIQCCYSPTDQMILITGSLGTHAHSGLHGERGGFLGHSMNFMVHGFTQKGVHFPCSLRFCEIIGSQPGKSGEIYKNEVVRELSLFCQKVRELFLNADYLDIKKISWFSLEIFWDYHFMLQVKLLKKMPKMFREICVHVREKVRELFFRFLVGTHEMAKTKLYQH